MGGGAMALKVERVVLIVSTSLAGSLGFVVGIAHFAGHFPTTASAFINPNTHKVTHDVWVWAYTLGFLVMVLVSTVVQFKTTSDRNKIEKEKNIKTVCCTVHRNTTKLDLCMLITSVVTILLFKKVNVLFRLKNIKICHLMKYLLIIKK